MGTRMKSNDNEDTWGQNDDWLRSCKQCSWLHFLSAPPQVTRLPLVLEGSLNFSYQPKGRGPTPDTLATATTTATDPVLPT